MHVNNYLGQVIQDVLDTKGPQVSAKKLEELPMKVPSVIPDWLNLKLAILGRAFSGKKTVAKQL